MDFKAIWNLIRQTFKEYSEDKVPRLAAALSYFTVFSLAPLLVLVIAITGFIVGNNETIRAEIIGQVNSLIGPQGAQAVETLIQNTSQPGGNILATIIGFGTLLLGATGLFGQLQDALNTIWEVQPKPNRGIMGIIKDRFLSFTMVLGVSFLLLVSLVISAALAIIDNYFSDLLGNFGLIAQILNIVVSIGVITLIFALIFKILPDVEIAWSDVWLGALVTAILFTIGRTLIGIYLGSSAAASAYGAAGSLVIILLWVFYSAQILFIGAEFTQVYARQHGSLIQPSENARAVTDAERAHQGAPRRQSQLQNVQQSMMPITGQPEIHAVQADEGQPARQRVRHAAPNPITVVPVIAGGAVAALLTVGRVVRQFSSGAKARQPEHSSFRRTVLRIRR